MLQFLFRSFKFFCFWGLDYHIPVLTMSMNNYKNARCLLDALFDLHADPDLSLTAMDPICCFIIIHGPDDSVGDS